MCGNIKKKFRDGKMYCFTCEDNKIQEYNKKERLEIEKIKQLELERLEIENLKQLRLKRNEEAKILKKIQAKKIPLYYITPIENLSSILTHGICCRRFVETHSLEKRSIGNKEIINERRKNKIVEFDKTLIDFVNFYFQPINGMLRSYDLSTRKNIIIIEIDYNIFQPGIFFSDGNAAKGNFYIRIFPITEFYEEYPKIEKYLEGKYGFQDEERKWRRMAECLIPENVGIEFIKVIHINQYSTCRDKLNEILKQHNLAIPIIDNQEILGARFD